MRSRSWSRAARSHSSQIWARSAGQLGRVEGRHLVVLVEEALEAGQVVVDLGPGHGRHEVVDDHGVGPALGLGALPGVVDHERVDEGQVAEGGVGPAGRRQADPLAGQPFQVAVLADVDDGVGAPRPFQPPVAGQVVVGRGQVGGVVDGDRVLAEPPGRLHDDEHAAEVEAGQADGAVVDVEDARAVRPSARPRCPATVSGARRTRRRSRRRPPRRRPVRAGRSSATPSRRRTGR